MKTLSIAALLAAAVALAACSGGDGSGGTGGGSASGGSGATGGGAAATGGGTAATGGGTAATGGGTGATGGGTAATGGGTAATGGGTAATGGGTAATGGGTAATGGGTATGGGAGGGSAGLTCSAYCTAIANSCSGANAQYTSNDICMADCAAFPVGTAADTSGDTLGCRMHNTGSAATCAAAGPTGGDLNVMDANAGTCGLGCDAFCDIAQTVCTGANQQFASVAACKTACATFATSANAYSTADTSKNDFGCRVYHVSAASTGGANATTHCPHIVADSAVCTQ